MKTFLLIIILVLTEFISKAQSPDITWAHSYGYIGNGGVSESVATDIFGNIYFTGVFLNSSLSFGSQTLTLCTGQNALFLVKCDSMGNVIWARKGCDYNNTIQSNGVITDHAGNVYITGYFNGDSTIFGNYTLRNVWPTQGNAFLVKYDSSGTVLWAKAPNQISNIGASGDGLFTDTIGNIYMAGTFHDNYIVFGTDTLFNSTQISTSFNDIFLVKYDSNGNKIWCKSFGGSKDEEIKGISSDGINIFLTGSFYSPISSFQNFDLINSDSTIGYSNMFLAKINPSGIVDWAISNPSIGNSYGAGVTSPGGGKVFITGNFSSNMVFGNDTLHSGVSTENIYVAACDTNGNYLWAKDAKQSYDSKVYRICSSSPGSFYITGYYGSQTIQFDSTILRNDYYGHYDIFLVKYDSSGNVNWAKSIGGRYEDFARGVASFEESVYITGHFWSDTVIFGNHILLAHPGTFADDVYIAKFSGTCTGPTITHQPTSGLELVGDQVTYYVQATGDPLLSYQWYQNGWIISGANDSTYTTYTLNAGNDSDVYYCAVSNCSFSNTVFTNYDTLNVCSPAQINFQNYHLNTHLGDSATFFVYVYGTQPLIYQWYKNGVIIPGATNPNYVTPPLTSNDSGSYYFCIIQNCNGLSSIQSDTADLSVVIGIDEINSPESKLFIFPNPVESILNIQCRNAFDEIKILDELGRVIYRTESTKEFFQVTIDQPGIYYVYGRTYDLIFIRKFVCI